MVLKRDGAAPSPLSVSASPSHLSPHSWERGTALWALLRHLGVDGLLQVRQFLAAGRTEFFQRRQLFVGREEVIAVYLKQLGMQRLLIVGGGLGFILVCLGAVSGYIRADEATKGYYTNRLRLGAAVGVGAAGMAIYQMLS